MTDLLRSLTGKRWTLRHGLRSDEDVAMMLRRTRNLTAEDIDPSTFVPAAAPLALERIDRAIRKKECIGVFGDYDCDGITSTIQLQRFLQRRGANARIRLPHRSNDGYGLQTPTVRALHAEGVRLLITVDNGIVAVEAAKEAKALGVDLIIIDHHRAPEVRPDAFAILHPDEVPAFGDAPPCAAGLTYLLIRAWEGGPWEGADEDLACAMLGTVADLVPLKGINRWIVQRGLEALHRLPPSCPLRLLADAVATGDTPLTCQDIAFRIAPRINAAGRMADPAIALEALLVGGEALASLETLNRQRQETTERLTREVVETLRAEGRENDACLCLASERFPPGIVGLLAGKLTETFGRPALVGHIRDGVCTGSLRSIAAYDIAAGLGRIAPLLQSFGGHAQAAGCTFALSNLATVREGLCRDIAEQVPPDALHPTLWLDAALDIRAVTPALLRSLEELSPHGQGNPEPVFLLENVAFSGLRSVGRDGLHLQGGIGAHRAIAWRLGRLLPLLQGSMLDVACRITRDGYRGGEALQLEIADIRLAVREPIAV